MSMGNQVSTLFRPPAAALAIDQLWRFDQEPLSRLPLEGALSFLLAKWDLVITQYANWLFNWIKDSKIIQLVVWISNSLCSISYASGFVASKLENAAVIGMKAKRSCGSCFTFKDELSLTQQIFHNTGS